MKTYLQIGANVGNDYFFHMCQGLNEKSRIILIEPVPDLIEDLKICYEELSKKHEIFFLNCGIVTEKNINNNVMIIFLPKDYTNEELKKHSPLSSFVNRKTISDLERKQIEVKTKTFKNICDEFKLENIEELHIDTEGYDYEILLSIDEGSVDIRKIYFEIWAHKSDDLNNLIETGEDLLPLIEKKYEGYEKKIISMDGMPTYYYHKNY